MKKDMCRIEKVEEGSIAAELGIEAGDFLLSINGEKILDVFDYRFLTSSEELVLEVQKGSGEVWEIELEKDEYEDLGLEFTTSMMDEAKSCSNKCVFCFIDQMPKGMRETLYFKDDDSRLSFLTGNYVTLTNMKDQDIQRIIRYRMSPINVSVHTTNPDLRISMLKNRFAGDVLERIRQLVDGGITVNCQIVLCRGLNDGAELTRTMRDLSESGVISLSVVPVGLTRHREGLAELRPFDREASAAVLAEIGEIQSKMLEKSGTRFVYPADEFFIMAGQELPQAEYYEDFPQIENGVGLLSLFREEFNSYLDELKDKAAKSPLPVQRKVSIATGVSAWQYIKAMAETLGKRYNGKVQVYSIINRFFGENVTVTGLLTGQDIVAQLQGKDLGEELLISRSMLKAGESVFLDDYTVERLEKELQVKVTVVENSGRDFVDRILGR